MDRREFLRQGGAAIAGTSGALGLPLLTGCGSASGDEEGGPLAGLKWGMVIDLTKCRED